MSFTIRILSYDYFTDLLKINYINIFYPISILSKLVNGASIPKKKQIDHIITINRKPKIIFEIHKKLVNGINYLPKYIKTGLKSEK